MTAHGRRMGIPSILVIQEGAALQLETLLTANQLKKPLYVFDHFTYEQFSPVILEGNGGLPFEGCVISGKESVHELMDKSFSIGAHDVIIGVGGGAVIDAAKYMAFVKRLPSISMPTSASNDGFSSGTCSLLLNGRKTTIPAALPYGIIADLTMIRQAPKRFLLAGIGDLMSNIPALVDWEFEAAHGVGEVNAFALMLSKKAVNSFIRTPMNDLDHPVVTKELVSSLTMGGIATEISGNSAPISGSEHLLSHALDQLCEKPAMHGLQVGLASYLVSLVQEHRVERMVKVFERTGFFREVEMLGWKRSDWHRAIDLAPAIKPNRYTWLHTGNGREQVHRFLDEDPHLNRLLKG